MPVENVIAKSISHCWGFIFVRAGNCFSPKIKRKAKTGARMNLKKVAVKKETFFKTTLEKEVETAQTKPAMRAKTAAVI